MLVELELYAPDLNRSFRAYEYDFFSQTHRFHAHDEVELAVVNGIEGILCCGAETCSFSSGDLFMFGGRLPHRFIPPGGYAESGEAPAQVVQFTKDALGEGFFRLPENRELQTLLAESESGLVFPGYGGEGLSRIVKAVGAGRIVELLKVLDDLAEVRSRNNTRSLTSGSTSVRSDGRDAMRLIRLQEYMDENYAGDASLDGAAGRLALTRTSFCRYVKRTTGRTYTELLNDFRLTLAAMKLRDTTKSVSTISEDSGYGSLSHFNARFRRRYNMTPLEYRCSRTIGTNLSSSDP